MNNVQWVRESVLPFLSSAAKIDTDCQGCQQNLNGILPICEYTPLESCQDFLHRSVKFELGDIILASIIHTAIRVSGPGTLPGRSTLVIPYAGSTKTILENGYELTLSPGKAALASDHTRNFTTSTSAYMGLAISFNTAKIVETACALSRQETSASDFTTSISAGGIFSSENKNQDISINQIKKAMELINIKSQKEEGKSLHLQLNSFLHRSIALLVFPELIQQQPAY